MPIYGFECHACGHRFDRLQRLSDPDPTTCPECSAHALRRQVSAPAFRLSGSGWYETDFKKDGDKKRNLADKGEGAPAAEKAEGKPTAADGGAKPASGDSGAAASGAATPAPSKAESKPAPPPAAG